jgi:hypothetical protein
LGGRGRLFHRTFVGGNFSVLGEEAKDRVIIAGGLHPPEARRKRTITRLHVSLRKRTNFQRGQSFVIFCFLQGVAFFRRWSVGTSRKGSARQVGPT